MFVGTRVPLATRLDYLEAGQPLSEFLEAFPTITREQAKEALFSRRRSLARSRESPATEMYDFHGWVNIVGDDSDEPESGTGVISCASSRSA